ncbi:hypothetical protein JW805_03260 [Roseomonas aeriglobus]|nr:hypothetical protein [Roseomonas aeriglobus]
MNVQTIEQPNSAVTAAMRDALEPLRSDSQRERIARWAGAGLSLAMLAAVGTAIGGFDLARIVDRVPAAPAFWIVFAAAYLLGPASEWVIFRQLWALPPLGIVPLLRKQVANEVLLGYSGEAQFYLWARRHAGLTGSPFGAIKDVAVLSALAGNIATLVMMAATAPLLVHIVSDTVARTFTVSVFVIVASSLAVFALRGRLFSLERRHLRTIFGIHVGRILLSIGVIATMWSLLLPGIALSWWLALATVRLMLSRLPLLPNKDVLFSGLTLLLLGRDADVTAAMAVMASLMLAAHLVVGVTLAAAALVAPDRAR